MPVTFRYFQVLLLGVRGNTPWWNGESPDVQFADINVYNGTTRVDYSTASASYFADWNGGTGDGTFPSGEPSNAIDNNSTTKFGAFIRWQVINTTSQSGDDFFMLYNIFKFTIDFGKQVTATQYSYTTGDDLPPRDPVSWEVYGSNDGTNYALIDSQPFVSITTVRETETQMFSISGTVPTAIITGTTPSIRSIIPGLNQVVVDYNQSTGGDPEATYYYSVDSSANANLVSIGSYTSPITISGISYGTHTIYITAKGLNSSLNAVWSAVDSSSATPYRLPSITNISLGINSVSVYFNSASALPSTTYYYSIDGSSNPVLIGSYVSYIDISGLSASPHSIYIIANGPNSSWTTYDVSFATPYSTLNAPSIQFQYLRYDFLAIRGNTAGIQFNDINVNYYNTRVDYSSATASWTGTGSVFGLNPAPGGIDGNISTKTGFTHNQTYTNLNGISYRIDFGKLVSATNYNYITGNDFSERDPISWKLYASTDGTNYIMIDSRVNLTTIPTERFANSPTFYMSLNTFGSTPSILSLNPISSSQIQVLFNPSTGGNPPPTYYYSVDGSSTLVSIGTDVSSATISGLSMGSHYITITARGIDANSNIIWTTSSIFNGSTVVIGSTPTINAVTKLPNNRIQVSFNRSFNGFPSPTYFYSLNGGELVNIGTTGANLVINITDQENTVSITARGIGSSSNVLWSTTSATRASSLYIPRLYYDGTSWTTFTSDLSYNIFKSSDGITWNPSYSSTANNAIMDLPTGLYPDASLNLYPGFNYPIHPVPSSISPSTTKYVHNYSDRGCANIQPLSIACGQGSTSMAYSVDGIQWVAINNAIFTSANKVVWNGVKWVAVGTGAYWVATSLDGLCWTGQNSTIMTECYDVAWNGSYFVAVGYNASVASLATSPDGITWTSVSIESVFSVRIHAIEWTGVVWLAYGSGTNTTAISTYIDASVWTPTPTPNLCVVDCSNILIGNISAITASSTNGSNPPENAFDGSFNTVVTTWQSDNTYENNESNGSVSTTYDTSLVATGEWLQVQLTNPVVCKNYYMVFSLENLGAIPSSWTFLGSNDGSEWNLLDTFEYTFGGSITDYPNNNPKYPFICVPLAIPSNTTAYSYYRIVFNTNFDGYYVSVAEFALFDGGSQQLDRYIRPIVLKDIVLHPTRILSVDGTVPSICRITDLSGNLNRKGILHWGRYVNNTVYGLTAEPAATTFDGCNHLVFSTSGKVAYLSNAESNTSLNFDNSFNGVVIAGSANSINAACYNRKFILFGDSAGSIRYGVLNANTPPTFYPTNASSLFSTIYGLASNSGYGFVVSPNTIYLKADERLSVVTPKFYDSALSSDTSISFNVYKA